MIKPSATRSSIWAAWPPIVSILFRPSKTPWGSWPRILNTIIGRNGTGFNDANNYEKAQRKAPNSKHQTPEKFQIPKPKLQQNPKLQLSKSPPPCLGFEIWNFIGIWDLGFGFCLDVGAWSFRRAPSFRPNQPHPALGAQSLLAHRRNLTR